MNVDRLASKYFHPSITPRDRAIFEGGIALGAIAHQFAGVPVRPDTKILTALEKAICDSMKLLPYKRKVRVKINRGMLKRPMKGSFYYQTLEEKHLDVTVEVVYHGAQAKVRMRYVKDLDFPLMYVESVNSSND